MQKILNSISIIFLSVAIIVLALMVGKLKTQARADAKRITELQKQRQEDRRLINGIGGAVIQLIQKQNETTY